MFVDRMTIEFLVLLSKMDFEFFSNTIFTLSIGHIDIWVSTDVPSFQRVTLF